MRSHSEFSYVRNRVSFLQIKLAMRRYCYGPQFGINTDSLAFTQVSQYRHPWENPGSSLSVYEPIKMLFSIDAQVCSEPLGVHIRMQDIVLHEIWEDSKIQVDSRLCSMFLLEICRHISLESMTLDIESVYNGKRTSFPYTCHRCNTVSLIKFRRIDSKLALIVTRWINLGPGIHRKDPLWEMHTDVCNIWTIPDKLPYSLMLQSPRTCFENTSSLSFEDLRSRNISYLRGDRYKEGGPFALERAGSACVWHISYKEPSKRWIISSLFSLLGAFI
jgi:hypothetical protein